MPAETSRAICSLIFGGVFERLPKLRFAFAHGGGGFSGTVGRVEHGFKARPDLVATDNKVNPREYLGKFWVDTAVFDPNFLRYIIRLYGSDKVCIGSDYPFPLGEWIPGGLVESMDFGTKTRANLMYKSALAWLGKKEADFK
jgi:aminocarboxymuconate-semialdehyde decarboxylase